MWTGEKEEVFLYGTTRSEAAVQRGCKRRLPRYWQAAMQEEYRLARQGEERLNYGKCKLEPKRPR